MRSTAASVALRVGLAHPLLQPGKRLLDGIKIRTVPARTNNLRTRTGFGVYVVLILWQGVEYRGTLLIRNRTHLGPYSRPMPRAIRWS
jgi:hypothetical protein